MYSKMLRQFSKGSLISISSESSKIHLLIRVLCRPIWFNFCRRYFMFHAPNISLYYFQQCNFMICLITQVFRHETLPLCQSQCTYVRGHSHVESSHSLHQNDATFQTHPPSTLHVKMPNLLKIYVYNFRYKTGVRILMKLFFLPHKCVSE